MRLPFIVLIATGTVLVAALHAQTPAAPNTTLTAVQGISVGHHTLSERSTGCTAILVEGDGAVGGV